MSPKDIADVLFEGKADLGVATDTLDDHPGISAFPYYTWEHAIIVPKNHPLTSHKAMTLDKAAQYPLITYDEGLTGRNRIDSAFEAAGIAPDFAMTALDSDVIKTYVEFGMGVGIIASMAYDCLRDHTLALLRCDGLFAPNASSIAVRRGKVLRNYAYRFIELCSPSLAEPIIRKAQGNASY
jgi:LysR family cys regulon transcriptional activator